jgi:hypothetical protein
VIQRFLKWLKCAWGGHAPTISYLETINGQLWATRETCDCGRVGAPMYPGAIMKSWKEHYEELPTEWPQLFGEDTD